MQLVEIFSVIGMSLFLLLGGFLLSDKRASKQGFVWLGIFFVLLSINFLDATLLFGGFYEKHVNMLLWEDPFALLYGPLIYFFTIQLRNGQIPLNVKLFAHLIPFFLAELFVLGFHLHYGLETKKEILNTIVNTELSPSTIVGFLLVFTHVLSYIAVSRRSLQVFRNDMKQFYSSEVNWAIALIDLVLIIFSFSILTTFIRFFGGSQFHVTSLFLVMAISIFLTARVLLEALRKPVFGASKGQKPTPQLEKEEVSRLKSKIETALSEKIYTNAELTLGDLSQKIGESDRVVSFIINSTLAENFYDLINDYRIEEAKRIFSKNKDDKLTVLEVLYAVGFNSKSSFNTQFKKKTGMTPSQFRKIISLLRPE